MKKRVQLGFAVVELVVAIVILAAIAGTGYYVMHNRSKSSAVNTANTQAAGYQSPPVSTPTAPQVNSASDLNSALQALNQTNVTAGNTDSSQLSSQANGF